MQLVMKKCENLKIEIVSARLNGSKTLGVAMTEMRPTYHELSSLIGVYHANVDLLVEEIIGRFNISKREFKAPMKRARLCPKLANLAIRHPKHPIRCVIR